MLKASIDITMGFLNKIKYVLIYFLCIIILWKILHFQYDEYEGILTQVINGNLTQFNDSDTWAYLSHFLLLRLYIWLGYTLPGICWSNYIVLFFLILSSTSVIYHLSKRYTVWFLFSSLIILFSSFFYRDSIFTLDLARYSMFIATNALLLFILNNRNCLLRIIATVCFLFSILSRIESVLPILGMSCFFVFYFYNTQVVFNKLFIPLTITVVVICGVWYDLNYNQVDNYYKKLEPSTELNISIKKNIKPLSEMTNAKDSSNYIAITNLIYEDTVALSYNFVQSIINPPSLKNYYKLAITSINNFKNGLTQRTNFWIYIVLISIVNIIFLKRKSIFIVRYAVVFFIGMYFISFFGGMTSRFFEISVLNTTLLLTCLSYYYSQKNSNRINILISTVFLIVAITDFLIYAIPEYNQKQKQKSENSEMYKTISLNNKNKTIVFDITSAFILSQEPFKLLSTGQFKYVILYDLMHAQHSNIIRSYTSKICNCNPNSYASFFSYLSDTKSESLILSTPERIVLKKMFLKNSYNMNFSFVQQCKISEKYDLYLYKTNKIKDVN